MVKSHGISRRTALKLGGMGIGAGALPLLRTQSAYAADLLAKVRRTKELVIGISPEAPLSFLDAKTHAPLGVIPDILSEFLQRENIDAKLMPVGMPFPSLIPSLQSGRIEVMASGMYIRPARAKVVDFTRVIFYNPEDLDVPKGNPKNLHSLADLCGHSAGTYEGTTYIELLKDASKHCPVGKSIDIKLYPVSQDVYADLAAGRLDAGIIDSTLSAYALKQNPSLGFEIVKDYKSATKATSDCALALAKGNQTFITTFNKVYADMLHDGSAERILTKWGLTPTSFFLTV